MVLCGVDGRRICVEESIELKVGWDGRFQILDCVAVVHKLPFALILGVDWIVKSRARLFVQDGELKVEEGIIFENTPENCNGEVGEEAQPVDNLEEKKVELKKRDVGEFQEWSNGGRGRENSYLRGILKSPRETKQVRFAGDEEPPTYSDEFLDEVKAELPRKRQSGRYVIRIGEQTEIPGGTLIFAKASIPERYTGNAAIFGVRNSRPGCEWVIPSAMVLVRKGKLKVPILNLQQKSIRIRPRDVIVTLDAGITQEVAVIGSDRQYSCIAVDAGQPLLTGLKLGDRLTTDEREEVEKLLSRRNKCFPRSGGCIGHATEVEHVIDTGSASPVRTSPYRVSAFERQVITEKVDEMLKERIIQPSFSPWASPVVLVKKKSGDHRFCIDYRRLNAVTKKDQYPLPRIDDVFDRLAGSRYFTSLDLASGYWQVPVAPADRCKTAFVTSDALYEFCRLPFGLCNAPATFSRLMDRVLGRLKWQMCLVYLDDVLVFGRTFQEHQERLELVLKALEDANLTLNPSKCIFATHEVFHLGHIVDADGLRPNPEKLVALKEMKIPHQRALRGFLGLASYYRRFIPNFATIAAPLHSLLKKRSSWVWDRDKEEARIRLIECLTSAQVLAHFDENLPVTIHTDASNAGLGAVISQDGGGGARPIAFVSRSLHGAEPRYHANELECLAVVWALKKLRTYIYGRHFTIQTDSSVVRWMTSKKELTGKFARWILALQEFDFDVCHVKGSKNQVADALSRNIFETEHVVCNFVCRKPSGNASHELAFQQRLDRQIGSLVTLFKASRRARKVSDYVMYRRVLYKRNLKPGRKFLLVVPPGLRYRILVDCHENPLSGHMGVEKTFARVAERYWWPNVRKSVKNHVLSCLYCQIHKHTTGLTAGKLRPISPPELPFDLVGIDHLGPFHPSPSENRHIIVAIDYFSKWVEAAAVPDTSADGVIDFVERNIIHRHGHPSRILSDQGPAFASHQMAKKMDEWGISHIMSTPEHPQTNGLCERVNRTLTLAIAAYVNPEHSDWERHLPAAVSAINSARQSTTEKTPFELVYGRRPVQRIENRLPWPPERAETEEQFLERVATLRKNVRDVIVNKQRRTKEFVDHRRRQEAEFRPGDLVLVRRNINKKGKTKKFLPKFVGPYQIVRKVCWTTYLVEDLPKNRRRRRYRSFRAHVCQMKRFRLRVLEDVALEEEATMNDEPKRGLEEATITDEPDIRERDCPNEEVPSVEVMLEEEVSQLDGDDGREERLQRVGRRPSRPPNWHRDFVRL